jgi:hypothetical protein
MIYRIVKSPIQNIPIFGILLYISPLSEQALPLSTSILIRKPPILHGLRPHRLPPPPNLHEERAGKAQQIKLHGTIITPIASSRPPLVPDSSPILILRNCGCRATVMKNTSWVRTHVRRRGLPAERLLNSRRNGRR